MNKSPFWVNMYDPEVPAHLEYPEIPVYGFLELSALKYPEKAALIEGDRSISYGNLLEKSRLFAQKLIDYGLEPGERVGVCLPNSIDFVISYYGILMAGGVVAAINPSYPLREIEFQIGISKPSFFIGANSHSELYLQLHRSHHIKKVFLTGILDPNDFFGTSEDILNFNDLPKNDSIVLPTVSPSAAAVLQFSGGTTGLPKAAVGLHKNIVANVVQFSKWLTPLEEGKETFLTAIPLFHVYGMVIGLNVGIAMGATIILIADTRNIGLLLQTASREKVTFFPGVPSIYHAINQEYANLESSVDLTSIKACISGSAPLLPKTKYEFERISGGRLVEGYGLSEAPTATHCNPLINQDRVGSIGLPLPDVECKIISLEDSTVVPVGKQGELLIKGPQVMIGYFEQPKETELTIENGWLHTGDIARMDDEGFFYIVGRKKEMIKVGGLQVWPIEIENVINQMPGIKECAVTGVEDIESGERVKLWLVLQENHYIDLQAVREFCKDKLASYKIPREIQLITSLPRSTVGKVLKYKLGE